MNIPNPRGLYAVFVVFAAGFLMSSLLRGVTAVLAPSFIREFNTDPAQLGLLAGAYFVSFAILQLPMGVWLDRHGSRRVLMVSLGIAATSCIMFAMAQSFQMLVVARLFSGIGVSACLIAPLTAARLWTPASMQQRITAWMQMSGVFGLILGTLPAEQIAAEWGWRVLFVVVGALFLIVAIAVTWFAPREESKTTQLPLLSGYSDIIKNRYILSIGPLGLFNYSILTAVQTLWVGPWLTNLAHMTSKDAAINLMYINGLVLATFLVMGYLSPKINKSAEDSEKILRTWTPLSIGVLFLIAYLGDGAGWMFFAAYCLCAWPLSVTHPLVGQRFRPNEAGRALAVFNLLFFAGVFFWQWGFGIVVKHLQVEMGVVDAYRVAMLILALLSALGYFIFVSTTRWAAVESIQIKPQVQ